MLLEKKVHKRKSSDVATPDVPESNKDAPCAAAHAKGDIKIAAYLNLAADFTHNFTDGLATDACQIGGKRFRFWDQFTLIAIRTGKHIPKADVYSSIAGIPNKQPNHQVFDNIVGFFAA